MANSGETRQNGGTVRSRQSKKQTNSTLGVSTSPVRKLKEKVEEALVLSWDDIPHWRRDNTFLLTGYRQSRDSYLHSLKALFYLHNESVNIWTHLSGAIITFLCATYLYAVVHPRYETATKQDILVFGCFFGGAVLCLGMSATFHTLIAHSESVMKWGNKLDYTGIVFLIVGSYMPALYYGLYCQPDLMKIYMAVVSYIYPTFFRCDLKLTSWTRSARLVWVAASYLGWRDSVHQLGGHIALPFLLVSARLVSFLSFTA